MSNSLMTTIEKINLITGKVQQLLIKQQELIDRNKALENMLEHQKKIGQEQVEANIQLRSDLEMTKKELDRRSMVERELKTKVSELETQVDALNSTAGKMDAATREAMEKQLNHYIKEIDKCISLLSQ